MAIFFLLHQNIKGLDKRYDKFWASILKATKHKRIVPDNVKVLTWNYDHQLIWSFNNFIKEHQHAIQACSTPESLLERETNGFFVGYLNGVAGAYWKKEYHIFPNHILTTKASREELLEKIVEYYEEVSSDEVKFNLRFAWEYLDNENMENSLESRYLKKIVDEISNTDILVIIGYSFPNFNNEVDKMLIGSMNKNLKKVYVQVPDGDFEERKFKLKEYHKIKNRFVDTIGPITNRSEAKKNIIREEKESVWQVKGVDEFFIPPEF